MGGHQPITGATITLYAATSGDGTTTFDPGSGAAVYGGYAGTPITLGTATTEDSTGTHGAGYFSITRNGNVCQDGANDQVYIVSNSGNPTGGLATNTGSYNPAAYIVAALGTCNNVTSATTVLMNEATTAAAAYALSGFAKFAADGSIGIGTSTTNKLGLTHAFANATALVNTVNGQSQTATAAGNGVINSNVLNTVSNALAQCVNSTGALSPSCSSLFVAYPTPNSATTVTPTTTWQLALGVAQYPAVNITAIETAGTVSPQFYAPFLAMAPNDFSVAITYTAATVPGGTTKVGNPWDIKADNADNIWISTTAGGGLVELSSTGVQQTLAQSTTLAADVSLRSIGIETGSTPRIWVADFSGTAFAYTQGATATTSTTAVALPASITVNGTATTANVSAYGLALDNSNNVFYATRNTTTKTANLVGEIPFNATTPVAKTIYTVSPIQGTNEGSYYAVADGKTTDAGAGDVLAPSQSVATLPVYVAPFTGAFTTVTTAGATNGVNGVAFDGTGSEWLVLQGSGANGGKLQKCTTTSGSTTCGTALAGPSGATVGLYGPRAIAIDGNGRLFVTSYTGFGVVEYDTTAGYKVNASTGVISPALTTAATNPRNATIDHSGALWISTGGSSTAPLALQVLGLAAPTDPVLANGNYGVKP